MSKNFFKSYKAAALIIWAVGVLFMLKSSSNTPRGINNNNPGNIRANKIIWDGQTGIDDKGFAVFSAPVYGLRAMFRTLDTYRTKYGINTIGGIINRWAPPSENNTDAYVDHVEQVLGVPVDQPLRDDDYLTLAQVIVMHENGQQPYSFELYIQAANMAGNYHADVV